MFSQDQFIEVSRNFVCVRLESYESEAHQTIIRGFLRGAFANTAFCILAPDGKKRLSGSGRSPSSLLRRRGRFGGDDNELIVRELEEIVEGYSLKGLPQDAVVPDFYSVRQSLNVSSADQRLLLLSVAPESQKKSLSVTLSSVLFDDEIIGRFHHDFVSGEKDKNWAELMEKESQESGFFIVQPDPFGMTGEVVKELPVNASAQQIKSALKKLNETYSESEERKNYSEHVREGRRKSIRFENEMPYGEDRDGDGVIDKGRSRRKR